MPLMPQVATVETPIVLELFTSQGCSSCPPADQLLKQLSAQDPSLLPLSFHVHYWDYLGWKDPYSSPANTERQQNYAKVLDTQVYTPELVVNGETGVIGSNDFFVTHAIASARQIPAQAHVVFTKKAEAGKLDVSVEPVGAIHTDNAGIWEIHYSPYARTQVDKGENGGRMLENINNVRSLTRIGNWSGQAVHYEITVQNNTDGIAVLVQNSVSGRILGAGSYVISK